MEYALLLSVGLFAGTLSGIVGFGSSIILMPVLVLVHGPLQAVPIMAIAALMANLSRILVWWRDVDWRAAGVYAITAAPAAALGARTLLVLPPTLVEGALGVFFILLIFIRRWLSARQLKVRLPQLAAIGVVIGFFTGVVVTTGPISAPVFLAYGLVKGAFLSTEAAGSLAVYLSKVIVFRSFGVLPWPIVAQGLIVGGSLMAGSFAAKRFVVKMDPERFRTVMDAMMFISGATMIWSAWSGAHH